MNITVHSTASALSHLLLQLGPAIVRGNCFGLASLLMILMLQFGMILLQDKGNKNERQFQKLNYLRI